jgi:hypothetical protein
VKALSIEPTRFYPTLANPVKIKVSINMDLLKNRAYKGNITVRNKKNEYNLKALELSLNKVVTSIDAPEKLKSVSVSPNPFTDFVNINFSLDKNCKVEVTIINASGQKIRNLVSENQGIGDYNLCWNGKDSAGNKVFPGVYFCTIIKGSSVDTIKLISKFLKIAF